MSVRALKPLKETQTRILDAAEELFMQHGFESASMRMLTAKAGVNLAAVNYHFGSKDALVEAVFRRRDEEPARLAARTFSRLLGRAYTEPAKSIRQLIGQMYAPAMERFKAAFVRALPELPKDELVWRMHFMFGTLAYTLAATDTVQLIAGAKPEDRYDARVLADRLTAFMSAGLLAPLPGAQRVRIAA